jgi:hypothetical protein
MNLGDTMEQHLNKLGAMVEKIDAIETIVLVEVKVMVLLMSLQKNCEFLITSLESPESIDPKKLAWEVVATRLLNEMERKLLVHLNHPQKPHSSLPKRNLSLRVVEIRQRTNVITIKN